MNDVEFAPWPVFADDEIDAAADVLRSGKVNYWTGDEGRSFEREFARTVGTSRAIALANGSVALELALLAHDIGAGDEVITTSRTFIASASSPILRGATPVFADVDRDSQNVTASTIEACITPRTKAIIPVHLAGWPCDMDGIMQLADQRGLVVIEDCAQALGATYRGRPVGSFGHAAAFSFCQDKIVTTGGEGGMLVTSDDAVWERAWAYKDHGKSYDAVYNRAHPPGFRWLHESFGTNWRMTEVQATIGRAQLRKLEDWLEHRRANAATLTACLGRLEGVRVPVPPAHLEHAYYKHYVFVDPDRLRPGWSRDRILEAIADEGVPCFSGSCSEVYLEAAFRTANLGPEVRLPVARELGETSLMFLVHPTLSKAAVNRTCEVVSRVMTAALG